MASKGYNVANAYVTVMPSAQDMTSKLTDALFPGLSSAGENAGKTLGGGLNSGVSAATVALGTIIGGAATKAASAFASTIGNGISRIDTLESFKRVMVGLGEDAGAADIAINRIKGSLDGLPTSTAEMASFVQQIKATGVGLDDSTKYALAFNNAMLAGGKGQAAANEAQTAYQNILVKGQADQIQWLRLVRASPAAIQQMAESLLGAGKNQEDLRQALNNGTVSMDDFNKAMVRLNEEGGEGFASFEEQARAATGGIQTSLDLIGSRMGQAWYKILDAIGQENITAPINAFSSSFGKMADVVVKGIETAGDQLLKFADVLQLENRFKDLGGILEQLKPLFDQLAETVGGALGRELASVASAVVDFAGAFLTALQPVLEGLAPLLSSIVELIGTRIIVALQMLTPLLQPLGELLGSIFEAIANYVQGYAQQFGDFWSQVAQKISEVNFEPLLEAINAVAEVIFNQLLPAVVEASFSIFEALMPVAEAIVTFATETLVPLINDLLIPIIQSVAGFITDYIIPAIEALTGWIVEQLIPAISAIFTWLGENLIPALQNLWAQFVEYVTPALEQLWSIIQTYVVPALQGMWEWVANNIIPVFSNLHENVSTYVIPILEALGNAFFTIGDWIGWVIDQVADLIGWLDSIKLPDIGGAIGSFFSGDYSLNVGTYASGGIITEPTLALRGERGTELEWPSYEPYMSKYASAIAANLPQGTGGGIDIHDCVFNVRDDSDIERIAYEIDDLVYARRR